MRREARAPWKMENCGSFTVFARPLAGFSATFAISSKPIHQTATNSASSATHPPVVHMRKDYSMKSGRNWLENCVGLDGAGKLAFTLGAGQIDPALLPGGHQLEPDGAVFEISPAREAFILALCDRLKTCNGAALLIDYGHSEPGFGDTFQALRSHTYADPLAEPGQADLTSHVDFAPLRALARATDIAAAPICCQGDFLLAMGLLQRAGVLGATADAARREQIRGEVQKLAAPDEMGNLFKVMGLWHCTDRPIPDLPPFHMPKTEH